MKKRKEVSLSASVSSDGRSSLDAQTLRVAVAAGATWLADVAMIRETSLSADTANCHKYPYANWRGAIRTEYAAGTKTWDLMCPVWHGGQAVKSLLLAADVTGEERFVDAARLAAEWICEQQVLGTSNPDHGIILAYEDDRRWVTVSAVRECLDGLIALAEHDGRDDLWQRVIDACNWLVERTYMGGGLFHDAYDHANHKPWEPNPYPTKDGGRPLLDDAVLLQAYRKTGDERFLAVHIEVAEKLLIDERPAGNWIDFGPCRADLGLIHPRQTYWFGMPLLETYRQTGSERFLAAAIRSGEFCREALRSDGGWIRGLHWNSETGTLNTSSFGHATSGTATAAILWLRLYEHTQDAQWLALAEKALQYCMSVQFTRAEDPNLQGAILEKVLPPDGTDRSPYYLRDLGTTFFLQAAEMYLRKIPS